METPASLNDLDFPTLSGGSRRGQARAQDAPSRTADRPPASSRLGRRVTLGIVGALSVISFAGLPYYAQSTASRVRNPLHPWLRPTGYVGQTAGLLSMALFLFLWLYPLRKKIRWLAFTGSIGRWLDVHIVAGITIPFLAAIHAAWHFTGLIGLGYGAMLVVCLSGIVGKYLYARIPRSRGGLELSLEQVGSERATLQRYIATTAGIPPGEVGTLLAIDSRPYTGLGPVRTLARMMRDDLDRFRAARRLRRGLRRGNRQGRTVDRRVVALVLKLARREMALNQQTRMLDATQRVFRYWHVAHRPVAITALIAVLVHVATAITLGVTWLH